MTTMRPGKEKRSGAAGKAKPELPWNVILHNDWDNSMPRVVVVLKRAIPSTTYQKAAGFMYEAHRNGRAVVKSCHKELAGLSEERLLKKGLSVSMEPSRWPSFKSNILPGARLS